MNLVILIYLLPPPERHVLCTLVRVFPPEAANRVSGNLPWSLLHGPTVQSTFFSNILRKATALHQGHTERPPTSKHAGTCCKHACWEHISRAHRLGEFSLVVLMQS